MDSTNDPSSLSGTPDGTINTHLPSICIPDILYIICSLLDNIKDVRRFRLCCRAFAEAAAPFMYRRIVIYPHKTDLDMLKKLSLNPIVAPNVRQLIYVGHVLGRPKVDFHSFSVQYKAARNMRRVLGRFENMSGAESTPPWVSRPGLDGYWTPPSSSTADGSSENINGAARQAEEIKAMYKTYTDTMIEQDFMFEHNIDTATLLETIPRFTSLKDFTFSNYWEFHTQGKTPFDNCLLLPGPVPNPKRGCRETVAILQAAASSGRKLDSLILGIISWRFFVEERTTMFRALETCKELTTFKICIDTGMQERSDGGWLDRNRPIFEDSDDEDLSPNDRQQLQPGSAFGTEVRECAAVMRTGLLRDFLRSLENLETIQVSFVYNSADFEFPARLEDIIQPKHTWDFLSSLKLENISCERQELMSVLRRHRETLDSLSLHNISLRSTSWLVLLPQIRKTMNLVNASVAGELFGWDERYAMDEYWDLNRDSYASELRFDVGRYLKSSGGLTRCPLCRDNNEA